MKSKKTAIIFDVDGTLAHMYGRILRHGKKAAPYIDTDAHDDTVDEHVKSMVNILKDRYKIIICSGRKSNSKEVLVTWLKSNHIHFDDIFMRDEFDNRKDSVVKKDIFENEISPKYNVYMVFDDRNQVVEMWRSLGIKCFQVQEGDF